MLPVTLDNEIYDGIKKSVPIIDKITDEDLREKVKSAWAMSLQINGYKKIEDMPGTAMPESTGFGDQSMHINVVAYNALSIYENLEKAYKMNLGLNKDILIAAAVLHDVGKPYEFSPENRERWNRERINTGMPNVRHPAYGTYIAIAAELPEEIVHVVACHSPEGRYVNRSAYATIVHYADDGSWFSLASLKNLNIEKL